jgi:hypothetical protein
VVVDRRDKVGKTNESSENSKMEGKRSGEERVYNGRGKEE